MRGAASLGEVVAHLRGGEELPEGLPMPPAALKSEGAKIFSTSADHHVNVSVTITPDGNTTWSTPNEPVFVWEEMTGRTCVGPTVFEQG